jgi:hypothetical protein
MPNRTNLVPNPSFEVNTTGWAPYTFNLANTIARSTVAAQSGSACLVATAPTATTYTGAETPVGTGGIPVQGGAQYTASAYAKTATAVSGRHAFVTLTWYDAAGTQLSSSVGSSTALSTAWARASHSGFAPGGAAFLKVRVACGRSDAGLMTAGEAFHIDAVMLEQIGISAPGAYFDGSVPDATEWDYSWTGTAHQSPSLATQLTVVGSTANALAATEMVGRCRDILIERYGKYHTGQSASPGDLLLANYINTKGEGIGWADVLADDYAASQFEFWAVMAPQVIVKHKSTGILYKVLLDPANTADYTTEKNLLANLKAAGKTWVPVYTAYDEYNVVAMQPYELLYTLGLRYNSTGNPLAASPDIGAYRNTPECQDMYTSLVDFGIHSLGLDANGRPVLISGCGGTR